MADTTINTGLLARFDAAHRREAEVAALLQAAVAMLRDEPDTVAWYGLKFGRGEFGIFDAFPDEAGRQAHLDGAIARALVSAGDLLDGMPKIEKVRVLAHKLPPTSVTAHKALLLSFPPRSGHEHEVEAFLRDARALVDAEPGTLAWFALKRDNGDYGIFDVFPDNGARFSHLAGHVPRELAKHMARLVGGMPEIHMLDVVAERER